MYAIRSYYAYNPDFNGRRQEGVGYYQLTQREVQTAVRHSEVFLRLGLAVEEGGEEALVIRQIPIALRDSYNFV